MRLPRAARGQVGGSPQIPTAMAGKPPIAKQVFAAAAVAAAVAARLHTEICLCQGNNAANIVDNDVRSVQRLHRGLGGLQRVHMQAWGATTATTRRTTTTTTSPRGATRMTTRQSRQRPDSSSPQIVLRLPGAKSTGQASKENHHRLAFPSVMVFLAESKFPDEYMCLFFVENRHDLKFRYFGTCMLFGLCTVLVQVNMDCMAMWTDGCALHSGITVQKERCLEKIKIPSLHSTRTLPGRCRLEAYSSWPAYG